MSPGHYYGMDGQTLTDEEAAELYRDGGMEKRSVAQSYIGEIHVSTVLLVTDHGYGPGPPMIFETMIFGGARNEEQHRYSTKAEAEQGHKDIVESLLKGDDPAMAGAR